MLKESDKKICYERKWERLPFLIADLFIVVSVMVQFVSASVTNTWDFSVATNYTVSSSKDIQVKVPPGVAALVLDAKTTNHTTVADYLAAGSSNQLVTFGPAVNVILRKTGATYPSSGIFISRVMTGASGNRWESLVVRASNLGYVPDPDLVALYRMDNDGWKDAVSGLYGTPVNGPSFTTDAKVGSHAGKFRGGGTQDHVITYNQRLLKGYNAMSIAMWAKIEEYRSWGGLFYSRDGSATAYGFEQGDAANKEVWFVIYKSPSVSYTTTKFVTNVWIFLVGTWDGSGDGKARIYVNGVLSNTAPSAINLPIDQNDFFKIAMDDADPSIRATRCIIDEVAIWKRALTPGEIAQLYVDYSRTYPLRFQLRAASNTVDLASKKFVGPDGTTNSYYFSASQPLANSPDFNTEGRYAQYKAYLYSSTDGLKTPYLEAVGLFGTRGGVVDNTSSDFGNGTYFSNTTNSPSAAVRGYVGLAKQPQGAYYTNGYYTSRIFSNNTVVSWDTIYWTEPGTELKAGIPGLIGLYHCQNWADFSGANHNGNSGGCAYTNRAKLGTQCAVFNGTTHYVDGFNFGTNLIQGMEFWLQNDNSEDAILSLTASTALLISNRMVIAYGFATNYPKIFVNGIENSPRLVSGWNHVAVSWPKPVDASGLTIGRVGTDYMQGRIDEMAIYNRQIESGEVREHFVSARPEVAGKVRFQARASATLNGLLAAQFVGPSQDPAQYYENTGSTNPLAAGTSGKYFQYRIYMLGDGNATPAVPLVRIRYDALSKTAIDSSGLTFCKGTNYNTVWYGDDMNLYEIAALAPPNMDPSEYGTMIGLYHMDEPAWGLVIDSKNGNNVPASGGAAPSPTAKVGARSGSFDGVSGRVTLGTPALGANPFSVCLWMRSSATNRCAVISSYSAGNPYLAVELNSDGSGGYSAGQIAFILFNGVSTRVATSSRKGLNDGQWHHIIAMRNSYGQAILYVDGDQVGAVNLGAGFGDIGGATPTVAANGAGGGLYYNGLIDEVAIFTHDLSRAEIGKICGAGYRTSEPSALSDGGQYLGPTIDNTRPGIWDKLRWGTHGIYNNAIYNLSPSLEGLWHLDETSGTTAYDSSGKNRNGVITGTVNQQGRFGKAVRLAGGGNRIVVTRVAAFEPARLTIEAWVNLENPVNQTIIDKRNATLGYALGTDGSGKPYFWTGNGAAGLTITGFQIVRAGIWHHFAGAYDGQKCRLYMNGEIVAEGVPVGIRLDATAANLKIGENYLNANSLIGLVDDVAIYSRALLSAEIHDHYKAGVATLKFQGRAWDPLPQGNFVGPGTSTVTYFTAPYGSDLQNGLSLGRYMQYRAFLSTEDHKISPTLQGVSIDVSSYPTDNPQVWPSTGTYFPGRLLGFGHTINQYDPTAYVRYQITGTPGTWYYWSTTLGQWVIGSASINDANTVSEINTRITSFFDQLYPKTGGYFQFRAFLHSAGDYQIEVDQVRLYAAEGRIVLTVPNGLEVGDKAWIVGVTNIIRWTTSGKVSNNLRLYYSENSGTNWTQIATGIPNTSNYYWKTPGIGGMDEKDHMRIRIVDMSDPDNAIYDSSDGDFQLRWRFNLIKPNGGEVWYSGFTNRIIWTTPPGLGGNAQLYVSSDSGSNWTPFAIVPNIAGITNNTYNWTIPKTDASILSERARIAVSIQGATLGFDGSDSDFTIAGIRIIKPVLNQSWKRGNTTNIVWVSSGAGGGGVRLELSLDNGTNYTVLITNNAPNVTGTNYFQWTISSPNPSANAKLRAIANGNPLVWGESARFTIADIDIKEPALGVSWQVGRTNIIKWTTGGAGDRVNLYYSANDGATWLPIPGGNDYPNVDTIMTNTFTWIIPSAPSTRARVKIADVASMESLWAQSARFNIAGVRIDKPNGSLAEPPWKLGASEKIYWSFAAAGPSQAGTLEISYGGSANWQIIAGPGYPLTATNYTYIPTNPTVQARVKLTATDPSVTNMWDMSDNYFTIAGIKVNRPNSNDEYTVNTLVVKGIKWTSAGTMDDTADAYYNDGGAAWVPLFMANYNDENYPGVNEIDWTAAMTAELNPSPNARIRVIAGSAGISGVYTGVSDHFVARGIKITKPARNEIVNIGTMQRINWIKAGIAADARAPFYLSTDGGNTFDTNSSILGYSASVGLVTTVTWMVSSTLDPSTNAVVKITITNSSKPVDINYSVKSKPFILRGLKFRSPRSGMNWEIGTTQRVSFIAAGAGAYADIQYASDGVNFDTVNLVAENAPITGWSNNYNWAIERTRQPSTNARLRVVSAGLSAVSEPFTVGGVMVTRPIASDIWAVGETNRIQWISVGTQGTNIIHVIKNGNVVVGVTNVTGNSYYWVVTPAAVGTGIVIKVRDTGGYYGVSPAFEIVSSPIIRVLSPQPGEFFRVSETYDIRWSRGGSMGNDFGVVYSTNNFITRIPIFGGTVIPTNSIYSIPWTLVDPSKLGPARIFITNMLTHGIMDTSGVFYLAPKFEVRQPNGGEILFANKPTTIKWRTKGDVYAVDIYYSIDPLRSPSSWVKINTTNTIPCDGHDRETSYTWVMPIVPHGSVMWIRVQDPHYTNRFDKNIRGPFDDSDNVFTVNWYRIVWDVRDKDTGEGLDKLSVSDSSGWSAANLTSNTVHYYPYGRYDTVWYREFFHDKVVFNWLADSSRTNTVLMEKAEVEPDYHVMANFAYTVSNRTFNINSWLERSGVILKNPDRCVIDVYWKGGEQIESLINNAPDGNGIFWDAWAVANTEAKLQAQGKLPPGQQFSSTDVFFAKVTIRYSGVEYSAGLTFALRLAAAEETVQAIEAIVATATSNILTNMAGISNAVSQVGNKVSSLYGLSTTNFAALREAATKTTNILATIEQDVGSITSTVLPAITGLSNQVTVIAGITNELVSMTSNITDLVELGPARILTRPTTVAYGSVNTILYKTKAGWDNSMVHISVSNAAQGEVYSANMTEVVGGIYSHDLTANWGTNSYVVSCWDPKFNDKMIITVVGGGTAEEMPAMIAGVSNRLNDLEAQLTDIQNLVAGIQGVDLTEVVNGLAQVQASVEGIGGVDLSVIDLSGISRIESRLGKITDPAGVNTFFGQLAALEKRLSTIGSVAGDAAKKAQSAKTEAANAASGVDELKTEIEKGNIEALAAKIAEVRESLQKAQENVQEIPKVVKIASLYDSMKEMAAAIEQLARSKGFEYLINLQEPAGGEDEERKEEDVIGVLNQNMQEIRTSMQFIQKLVDEMRYEPEVMETLTVAE